MKMKAVLVGEAWGRRENQFGHALVGPSGRELTQQHVIAGFAPEMLVPCRTCRTKVKFFEPKCPECGTHIWPNEFDLIDHWKKLKTENEIHVTNVFNEQPPKNDLGHFFGTTVETNMTPWRRPKGGGSHLQKQHYYHIERLYNEIENLKPNLVVAMGNAACWALLDSTGITSIRGTLAWSERTNCKVLPTFHPANVLRSLRNRVACIADWRKAKTELEFPEIRRKERWLTILPPTQEGIDLGYRWLKRPARAYANDIETLRDLISVVGFARTNDDALVIPIRDGRMDKGKIVDIGSIAAGLGLTGGINYWPTKDLEFQAWKLINEIERTEVDKIYQNGLFDISYLGRMGIFPKSIRHDTMLWHHSKYPELPKSLGFLGSIYANEVAWKNMRHSGSLKRDE